MDPKISVIVPVYNAEKYLPACLDSLVNQKLKEIEIVVINDGSTDGSERICRAYAERDSRIKVYSQANGGVAAARNHGLRKATAKIIGFLDSDDNCEEDMYQNLLEMKEKANAQIAVCGIQMTTNEGEVYQVRSVEKDVVLNRHDAMKELLQSKRISSSLCNKIFDAALFDEVEFPVGKLYEDEYAVFKLFTSADSVAITSQAFYHYRFTPKSITHKAFCQGEIDRIYVNLMKVDYIRENYPDLLQYAQRYLVYVCVMALSKMTKYEKSYDNLIKSNIQKHLGCFLKGDYSKGTKLFALIAACSPGLSVRLYRCIMR